MSDLVDVHQGKLVGAVGNLYQCVFERVHEEVRFVKLPLKRGLLDIRHDDADVLIPLAQSASRDQFAEFGGALLEADYVFISQTPLPSNFERLGLRYGIPRSFVGRDLITDTDAVIEEVSEWSQLPMLLERNRIDIIVLPSLIATEVLGKYEGALLKQYAGTIPASLYMSSGLKAPAKAQIRHAVQECSTVR
jgi:polar amino acid transport system substrate-binding protein